jgi:predicted transcriptional regulator
MSSWLSRIDKDTKAKRDRRIFSQWLACYTQEEIAEKEGMPQETVRNIVAEFSQIGSLADSAKLAALHQVDFEIPFTNRRIEHISAEVMNWPSYNLSANRS